MPQRFLAWPDKSQDGRVKILPSQYPEIRRYYNQVKSQRKTAAYFKISRRLVVFILYPDRYQARLKARRDAKVNRQYYNKDTHKVAMQKHRLKKRKAGLAIKKI